MLTPEEIKRLPEMLREVAEDLEMQKAKTLLIAVSDFLVEFTKIHNTANREIDCLKAEILRLKEIIVKEKKLRSALVGLVGVDGMEELEQMEASLRLAPAPIEDKVASINAVHALMETL